MRKILWAAVLALLLSGCRIQSDSREKVRDLDFVIMQEKELPEALLERMEEKKKEPFKLTYRDEGEMYLCAGYGEQETGGFSIVVEELYETENAICFNTTLVGPQKGEEPVREPSCPRIIVRIEDTDMPVIFQ